MGSPDTRARPDGQRPPPLRRWLLGWLALSVLAGEGLARMQLVRVSLARLSGMMVSSGQFFGAARLGIYLQLVPRMRGRDRVWATALGLLIEGALLGWRLHVGDGGLSRHAGGGLAMGALVVVGARGLRPGPGRIEHLEMLGSALLFPLYVMTSEIWLETTYTFHPWTFDEQVARVDGSLGAQPSFVVGRWFQALAPLRAAAHVVYAGLPAALATLVGLLGRRSPVQGDSALLSVFMLGGAGLLTYHLFPVIGPCFAFKEWFPQGTLTEADIVSATRMLPSAWRNCMPSLHTAWALVIVLRAWPHGATARLVSAAFFLLTELATLGFGYHYALDLLVALPFAVTIDGLADALLTRSLARYRPVALAGAGLVALWLLALGLADRWLASHPVIVAAMALATIGATVGLARWRRRLTG